MRGKPKLVHAATHVVHLPLLNAWCVAMLDQGCLSLLAKPKRVMYRISNGAFAGCAAVILLPNRCQIWQISYGFQDEVLMRYAFS